MPPLRKGYVSKSNAMAVAVTRYLPAAGEITRQHVAQNYAVDSGRSMLARQEEKGCTVRFTYLLYHAHQLLACGRGALLGSRVTLGVFMDSSFPEGLLSE
jgi:hypothetical protein